MNEKPGLNYMHKTKIAFTAALCLMMLANALAWSNDGSAGYPGEFLRYGVGPRAMGMGGAFTALADDASAVYWNPGGLMNVMQNEFTSMYTNLFYDTRYTFMGAALPRFVDRHTSVGFGWVNLAMNGFDERNNDNIHTGSFDVYEQAFMVSAAREWVSTWAIVNYGINLNLVNQAFPGYTSDQGWGFGTDLGATIQFINPVVFKVPLKYLLPLKFGVSLKNVISPKVGFSDDYKDEFPFSMRAGASYGFTFDEWYLSTLYDFETIITKEENLVNHYGGFEAVFPLEERGIIPKLRAGYNSKSQAPTFGAGIAFNATKNIVLNIDMAYAFKPDDVLENDIRLFLSLNFGTLYDDHYFLDSVSVEKEKYLQILAQYPNDNIEIAAENLGTTYDTKNAERYFRLIGGLSLANKIYASARKELENDNIEKAKNYAKQAMQEYDAALQKSGLEITDNDKRKYSECAAIIGNYRKSIDLLKQIDDPDYRSNFLLGTAFYQYNENDSTLLYLQKSIDNNPNNLESMQAISLFLQGNVYFQSQNYDMALSILNQVAEKYNGELHPFYSKIVFMDDENIDASVLADDAEVLMAKSYEQLDMKAKALESYYNVQRYYPFSNRVEESQSRLKNLLGSMTE